MLPHMPYSTDYNGKMGGNVDGDGDAIIPDKAGIMGSAYLRLWTFVHDDRYKNGALNVANTLLRCHLPEGRWQGRINNQTGAVEQDYTFNALFYIAFFWMNFTETLANRVIRRLQRRPFSRVGGECVHAISPGVLRRRKQAAYVG